MLADGRVFEGVSIGASAPTVGEVVFTTGMTGYQEVIADPSYAGQLVTMTAPQMGNTGVNAEDTETVKPRVAGFIVHELSSVVSNWRANESLDEYLKRNHVTGIACIDTRALTRHIRDTGAQMAAIGAEDAKTLTRPGQSRSFHWTDSTWPTASALASATNGPRARASGGRKRPRPARAMWWP